MVELTSISYLQQISDFKHHIDKIDKEIDEEIKKTKDLEINIIQVSKDEQQAIQEKEQWKKNLIQKEVQHMDLEAITTAITESIIEAEENLELIRKRSENLHTKLENERDSFIETCKLFKLHQREQVEDETELKLMEQKFNLLTEVRAFRKIEETLKISDQVLSQKKVDKLQGLQTLNEGLRVELSEQVAHNQKLLTRIEALDDVLLNIKTSQDIIGLEAELISLKERKQNLEAGVLALRQQLPLFFNHEEKLDGLLKEQQPILQDLQQKLQGVKSLQKTFKNEHENECKLSQKPQSAIRQIYMPHQQSGPQHRFHETGKKIKIQRSKRHK